MVRLLCYLLPACLAAAPACPALAQSPTDPPHARGWIEHARLLPHGLLMEAKLDSGARTTSIHAEILDPSIEPDPEPLLMSDAAMEDTEADAAARMEAMGMVDDPPADEVVPVDESTMAGDPPESITFRVTNATGRSYILRRQIVRWVDIRRRGGGSIRRPVVEMQLCIGGRVTQGEVNLADRTGFNYPLLIGRNMLSNAGILVDSREVHVAKKACPDGI